MCFTVLKYEFITFVCTYLYFFQNRQNLKSAYGYTQTYNLQHFTQIRDVQISSKTRNSLLLINFVLFDENWNVRILSFQSLITLRNIDMFGSTYLHDPGNE